MADYKKYADQELVGLLKKGDHAAFGEIHRRYYPLLYSHAFKRLPYREEVKDILQELFTYVWDIREELNFTSGLAAYLYTSVRNRVVNVFNRDKIRQQYASSFADYIEQGDNEIDLKIREREMMELIAQEIAALPAQMRKVFILSRYEHKSHNEIAEMMNTSPLTVRKQIQNTLKILRGKLGSAVTLILI